jgi:hypothetical protein
MKGGSKYFVLKINMNSECITRHANGGMSEHQKDIFFAWKIPRTMVREHSRTFGAEGFK